MNPNFIGAAKRLDDIDLPKIGALIGVGEDELHAFMEVETSGRGFDEKKRPKMLFEPHVFYRLLPADKRPAAVSKAVAYPKWGEKPYPLDSYPRLAVAMTIDKTIALKSASWGLGQIMGYNHEMVGYSTVEDMIAAFMEDEEHHLKAIVDFIIANGIDDDLKARRWEMVARVYNGPGYAKHGYHIRMANAFKKWQGIRDTPYNPAAAAPASAPAPTVPAVKVPDGIDVAAAVNRYLATGAWKGAAMAATDAALRQILADFLAQIEPPAAPAPGTGA